MKKNERLQSSSGQPFSISFFFFSFFLFFFFSFLLLFTKNEAGVGKLVDKYKKKKNRMSEFWGVWGDISKKNGEKFATK